MTERNRRSTDDWLDSDEFKTIMKAYWVSSLNWHARIDQVKAAIRANYKPPSSRLIKQLTARIEEQQVWIDKLTETTGRAKPGPQDQA